MPLLKDLTGERCGMVAVWCGNGPCKVDCVGEGEDLSEAVKDFERKVGGLP